MEQHELRRIRIQRDAQQADSAALILFPATRPNGLAVVMCPGGGFDRVAAKSEGEPFAPWFGQRGVTFAVLEYRLPNGHADRPAEDMRWALRLLRSRAEEWGIVRVGVMGASIGGHIAATAAQFEGADRPAFQILLYPVISMLDEIAHRPSRDRMMGRHPDRETQERYSCERRVTAETPPAFLVLSEDDPAVSPLHGLRYFEALCERHVPAALHVYPRGGHGFGFRDDYPYKSLWLRELDRFLRDCAADQGSAGSVGCSCSE